MFISTLFFQFININFKNQIKFSVCTQLLTGSQKMLMSKCTEVKLQKTYKKILYLYEAYNQTFVFLGNLGIKQDCLVHVNKKGRQLFCHHFQRPMDTLGMMNDFQAITLQTRANCITIIDLRTYEIKRMSHYFIVNESDQVLLYTFPITKYVAIVEHGRYNDNRLKLTYINYPKQNITQVYKNDWTFSKKQYLQQQAIWSQGQWTYEYTIRKGNHHSMVIWMKPRQDQIFQFKIYCQQSGYLPTFKKCKETQNGWQYKQYRIQHKLKQLYEVNSLQLAVLQVFQVHPNVLLLFGVSNRQHPLLINGVVNNNYRIDLQKQWIKQTNHMLSSWHSLQIDQYLLGSCHMIRTYSFNNGQPIPSPVYYISNQQFKIVSQSEWQCSHLNKYVFPGYDQNTMIQSLYDNADVKQFTCFYRKLMEMREVLLFLLQNLYPHFDDDLLHDVIKIVS